MRVLRGFLTATRRRPAAAPPTGRSPPGRAGRRARRRRSRGTLEPLPLPPLPADVPALQRVSLRRAVPPPDERLDVVGHHQPAQAPLGGPQVAERRGVGRPLAVPEVHRVTNGEIV